MRVVIVDFNHMAHTYFYSQHRLSVEVNVNGKIENKDTTIQNGTIKNIHRWSKHGGYPTACCFDRPVPARKAFFQTHLGMKVGTENEYKGGRSKMPEDMFMGISEAESLLRKGGVCCFSENNYEADDLIFACVQRAKVKYPGVPIDIITNDADLLPLVDETVSVFLRSKKGTYAESKDLEKAKYIQVTPRNFQSVVEDLSNYRGFVIPYNSILLFKLLRGDPSDRIGRSELRKKMPPRKYNAMVLQMLDDGVEFDKIFRYGKPVMKIMYKGTNKEFEGTLEEALVSSDRDNLYQKVCNTKELDEILSVLRKYSPLDEKDLETVESLYWGMNLNQCYPNANKSLSRREYELAVKGRGDIDKFEEIELQKQLRPLKINLDGMK